ncbi:MAG: hypothetical protein H7833_10020 [Magnetococcus sp. DMHC-1]
MPATMTGNPTNATGNPVMFGNGIPQEIEWAGKVGITPGQVCPVGGKVKIKVVTPPAAAPAPGTTPPCPVGKQAAPVTEWEAPEAPKTKTAKAGAGKAGAAGKAGVAGKAGAAVNPGVVPAPQGTAANMQTVAMTGTKSAGAGTAAGAVVKTGGTIWSGTGSSLGLGLGLGAWGPVLLVGVATAIGFGTYYYMKKRHTNAEELTEATS